MSILTEILDKKRKRLEIQKQKLSLFDLKERLKSLEFTESTFLKSLQAVNLEIRLIGEIKRASPSHGRLLGQQSDILEIAKLYKANGVTALSILTEENYFLGSINDLETIKQRVAIPILRKDFIIEEYQIYESKYYNSDAILLIVRILDLPELKKLSDLAKELNIEVLFEIHSQEDLEKVLKLKPKMIGINNRDLDTLKLDLNVSAKLLPQVPEDIFKISESGIKNFEDIVYLKSLGADAFLVGESILKAEDKAGKIRLLLGYG